MEDTQSIGSLQSQENPPAQQKPQRSKTIKQAKRQQSGKDTNRQSTNDSSNGGGAGPTDAKRDSNVDSSSVMNGMVSEKEYKREKKLRKVLKEALNKETERVKQLEKEIEKMRLQNEELEKENKEKETKYLDLYMENSQQHEQIVQLQSQLLSNPFHHLEKESNPDQSAGQAVANIVTGTLNRVSSTIQRQAVHSAEEVDQMKLNYEKRINELQMMVQKQERDIAFKEEELRKTKNIAREVAEKLEPVQRKENQFAIQMEEKLQEIQLREIEISNLKEEILQLKAELNDSTKDTNRTQDLRLQYESKLDKKEEEIYHIREENVRLRDTIKGKDDAIEALTHTLIDKGEHNKRLTEKLAQLKNHQLSQHYLNQWFLVTGSTKKGDQDYLFRFYSDKSENYHYFLEIREKSAELMECLNDGSIQKLKKYDKKCPPKRINAVDIESIEPIQRSQFALLYYEYQNASSSGGGLFGSSKSSIQQILKEENYHSRHIAEIIYAYHQILETLDSEEKELGIQLASIDQTFELLPPPKNLVNQSHSANSAVPISKSQPSLLQIKKQDSGKSSNGATVKSNQTTNNSTNSNKGTEMLKKQMYGRLDYEYDDDSSSDSSDDSDG